MRIPNKIATQLVILLGLITILFGYPQPAAAFEVDDDGQISANEVIHDDLMISALEVVIDGTVNGNVFASAEVVIVNGTINGNLLINAATAEINGEVNGSVAMAGKTLNVNSTIQGTIYFAGAELILSPDARVNRNILFTGYHLKMQPGSQVAVDVGASGYQTIIGGEIGRDLTVDMGGVDIKGMIGGDVRAKVADPGTTPDFWWMETFMSQFSDEPLAPAIPTGLRVAAAAEIGGELAYQSTVEQVDAIQAVPANGILFEQTVTNVDQQIGPGVWVIARLRELLTLVALGGLILWITPRQFQAASAKLEEAPFLATGWGFVTLVLGYALAMVLFLTIIFLGVLLAIATLGGLAQTVFGVGFSGLSLAVALFTLLVVHISKLIAAWAGTKWLLNRFIPGRIENNLVIMLIGVTAYVLLRTIPIVSIVVNILATLMGLGAIWILGWEKKKMKMEMKAAV